jgi:RNA polymerase primary sigma factor
MPSSSQALPGEAASPTEPRSPNGPGGNGAAKGERAIHLYLREIGQVELLTPQQELELVLEIKQGNQKARHRLLTASLRRVVQISREYESIGLPLLDLISEGNMGLLKAIERFDPARGG